MSTTTQALVSIPNATASQIIGDAPPTPVASGTLSLLDGGAGNDDKSPLLLIQVDSSIFPLYSSTTMGTHEGKEEWYTFSVDESWIRLVLPPLISPDLTAARDKFESHLISHSLLLDGLRATGDELGQSASQAGKEAAQSIHTASVQHTQSTQPTDSPWTFSRVSHGVSQGFKDSTEGLVGFTTAAANAVAGVAGSVGAAVGSAAGGLSSETKDDLGAAGEDERIMPNTRDAVSDAFSGAGQGLSNLTSSLSSEAPRVATHNVGEEATSIAADASRGVGNVARAGVDVTLGTSSVYHGVEAAKGAVQSQSEKGQEDK